jgi:predicted RNA-binding Zn-ribbon protein involved in translation (DUF1610 family)
MTPDQIDWSKTCPSCGKRQIYKSRKSYENSSKKNKKCLSCSLMGKHHTEETKNKLRIIFTGRKHTPESKMKISICSKNMSEETRKKISLKNKGRIGPWNGKRHSEETKSKISKSLLNLSTEIKERIVLGNKLRGCSESTREKMRLSHKNLSPEIKQRIINNNKHRIISDETRHKMRISFLKNFEKRKGNGGQLYPVYNSNACMYFDNLSQTKGWNLKHAMNGGEFHIKELGYWVDAYDIEKNIVVEYDEPHHTWGSRKIKDEIRMEKIKDHLGCKFFRYNQQYNLLKEY